MNFDPTQHTPLRERSHIDVQLTSEAVALINRHILKCRFAGVPLTRRQISDAAVNYCLGLQEECDPAFEDLQEGCNRFVRDEAVRHYKEHRVFPFSHCDEDSWDQWKMSMMLSHWVIHYLQNVIGEAS